MRHQGIVRALNGDGFHAPGMSSKGGKAAFEKNVGIHSPESHTAAGKLGGKIVFDKKVGIHSPELAGYYGPHVRWHVNRGIVNPRCAFCCDDTLGP